jgi:hypothetical protein
LNNHNLQSNLQSKDSFTDQKIIQYTRFSSMPEQNNQKIFINL